MQPIKVIVTFEVMAEDVSDAEDMVANLIENATQDIDPSDITLGEIFAEEPEDPDAL